MDIRQCFPKSPHGWATPPSRNRLQYGNKHWTPDQEADYLQWRNSIPYTNLDIAAGYLRLARHTPHPNLARAYRTRAGQLAKGYRVSRKDYKTVLFFLATHVRLSRPSKSSDSKVSQAQTQAAKVSPGPAPASPGYFRKAWR